MKTIKTLILIVTATLSGAALAQQTPNLDKREAKQQKRIDQGVRSGQLTPKEAGRLEAREAKLNADEAAAKSDGKVTPKERAKLQHEASRDSRRISRQKHDAQKQR